MNALVIKHYLKQTGPSLSVTEKVSHAKQSGCIPYLYQSHSSSLEYSSSDSSDDSSSRLQTDWTYVCHVLLSAVEILNSKYSQVLFHGSCCLLSKFSMFSSKSEAWTVCPVRRGIRTVFDTYVLLGPLLVSFCWPLWWILYSGNCISSETNGSITFFWRTLQRRIRTVIGTDARVSRLFFARKFVRWFVQS